MSIDEPGVGYTLLADSIGFAGSTSSVFNILVQEETDPEPPFYEPPIFRGPDTWGPDPEGGEITNWEALWLFFSECDERRKWEKCYEAGRYRTNVMVFEGVVKVSEYTGEGMITEDEKVLKAGDELAAEGEVE